MEWIYNEAMVKTRFWLLAFLLFSLLAHPHRAQADDVYTVIVKKQEEKKKARWSLSDWLETKEKIRLMDMWLALHTPSPFEFYTGLDYRTGSIAGSSDTGWGGEFAAYASIFGIGAQYESFQESRFHALFRVRIFGYHEQSTHIVLEGGLKQEIDGPRSPLMGAKLALYLHKYFGVEGLYRHYFDSASGSGAFLPASNRFEGSAFIDFSFLRVYGTYFSEPISTRTGSKFGLRFFF